MQPENDNSNSQTEFFEELKSKLSLGSEVELDGNDEHLNFMFENKDIVERIMKGKKFKEIFTDVKEGQNEQFVKFRESTGAKEKLFRLFVITEIYHINTKNMEYDSPDVKARYGSLATTQDLRLLKIWKAHFVTKKPANIIPTISLGIRTIATGYLEGSVLVYMSDFEVASEAIQKDASYERTKQLFISNNSRNSLRDDLLDFILLFLMRMSTEDKIESMFETLKRERKDEKYVADLEEYVKKISLPVRQKKTT